MNQPEKNVSLEEFQKMSSEGRRALPFPERAKLVALAMVKNLQVNTKPKS